MRSRILTALFLLAFAGCSTMEVNSAKAPNANLSKYRTYAWADSMEGGAARQATILDQTVKSDVEQQLQAKGLKPAVDSPPDLLISYTALTKTSVEYGVGPGYYWGEPYAYPIREGELRLHFVDPKTNKVVWEAAASDAIGDDGGSQKLVAEAVQKMMEKYPA